MACVLIVLHIAKFVMEIDVFNFNTAFYNDSKLAVNSF